MTLTPSTSSSPTICLTYTDALGGRIDTGIGLEEVWNGLYDMPKYREQIAKLCSLEYQPEK